MAQNTNSSNKVADINSSVLISSPNAQSSLSWYLQEQQSERMKIYHKHLKQKTEAGNFTSFSICPLLHSFDVSDFKVSSQRNTNTTLHSHSVAAAACRRKCNSTSIKYFNYGEKSTFQHGISASEALEEYRRANVYTRSRLYKSNQDALEISILLKSDIQRIAGVSRGNDTFVKPTTNSLVIPTKVPPIDCGGEPLQEKTNKRKPKEKAPFSFRHKQSKERPAIQMNVVSIGLEETSQIKQNGNKLKHAATNVTSMKDIGPYQEISVKKNLHQSAGDANILTFVQKDSRDKQKDKAKIKQRSLSVSATMSTKAEEPVLVKAIKL